MTFDDFAQMERTASRVNSGLRALLDDDARNDLTRLEFVLAEIRHAAFTLCDNESTAAEVDQARQRLLSLFTIHVPA